MSKRALKLIQENKKTKSTTLDLGNCDLTQVPEALGELVWLEELILSNSWQEYDFEKKHWEQKYSQNEGGPNKIEMLLPILPFLVLLKKLIFSNSEVSDLSSIAGLTNLQQLYCDSTKVSNLLPIARLTNLQQLCCDFTQVSDLSPIAGFTNLKQLSCDATKVSDLSPIAGLTNLQQLYCDSTKVSDLSPIAGLTNLKQLFCNSTQVSVLSPIAGLTNLQQLYCDSTKVTDLSPLTGLTNLEQFSCDSTKVSDLSPIAGLTNLQQLYCSDTKVSDLSSIAGLTYLQQLYCSNTKVSNLSPIAGFTNLQLLDCNSTQVSDLSPILPFIKKGIQIIWRGWVNDNEFNFNDCPLITPPVEIVKQGNEAILRYFEEIERLKIELIKNDYGFIIEKLNAKDTVKLLLNNEQLFTESFLDKIREGIGQIDKEILPHEELVKLQELVERLKSPNPTEDIFIKVREAKVLLVGQGKSGKTTLRKKLEDPDAPMPAPGDTTRGIEITRLNERMPHTGEPLRLNIWDFGGQDIQHYAHQFFLTGSSLYALVTNERIQDSVHLPYWLNIIEMLGKKSPVIVIQNKDGGNCQALKDEAAIRARFANVYNRVFQSDFSQAQTEEEFAALRKKIVELASELPHIEKDYLISFNSLREKIEAEADSEKHYLRWENYLQLMPELGEDLMRDYANALTFLGVCQYFPEDAMLSEYVFLRPKWLIDALFELLLHPSLESSRGHFSENDTRKIWKREEYRGMHSLLVRMMKEFELCYRVDGDGENYIVPQRLPGENKTYGWNPTDDIPVQFKYKFMPKGILTRLICRLHPRIENDSKNGQRVWNDAVIFTLPNGKGRVFAREVYSENIIELRATGEKHSEILNEVIRKMDDINVDAKYDNLQVEKLVPCPCSECATAETPGFHEFDALQKRIEKGKTTSECKKSGDDVPIDDIFGKSGIKKPKGRNDLNIKPGSKWAEEIERFASQKSNNAIKIFLASSFELQSEREKIELEINRMNKDLRRQGIFLELLIWEDGKHIGKSLRSQDNYNLELDSCDVFFLLFYSKIGKFTKEEFERAKARFDESDLPRMVLFQKNTALPNGISKADFDSRQTFLDYLKGIEHYPTEFGNTDALIRMIRDCIDNLIADNQFMNQLTAG